jgi:Domain of unknown function (DUF4365)
MEKADFIGGRGQAIAHIRLASLCRVESNRPYFVPHFLGEKFETFDFLLELVDAGQRTPFFFVQVKSTRKPLTRNQSPSRLRVELSKKDVLRMVAYPAPTYLVGIQEVEERAFIIAIHGTMSSAISSITTAHELTPDTLRRLWEEVREFWSGRDMHRIASSFPN